MGDISEIQFFVYLKTSVTYTLPQHWHFSNQSWIFSKPVNLDCAVLSSQSVTCQI